MRLDEIIEEFKNSEESKALDKVNENTKKLLIRNAGLQEEYDAWKEEKGYE